jgi:5,10-methylene-tetrahydrofolate dehydrogenase/methenyl tetrahydrofolate cyclohydrolase
MLLHDQIGDLSGLDAIVIGRSILVGKPMAALLTAANCTVTLAHSRTRDPRPSCQPRRHRRGGSGPGRLRQGRVA